MQFSYNSEYNTENVKYTGPYAIVRYEGEKIDNKMNGLCKILFANSNTYEGYIKDDKLHGKGILIDNVNGSIYEGDFVEDRREGFGKFTYKGFNFLILLNLLLLLYVIGGSYEGAYVNNKKNGEGIERIGESILKGIIAIVIMIVL